MKLAVSEAGQTYLNPILLTVTATVLRLILLALGINLNFYISLSEFELQFFMGGKSLTFGELLA